MFARAALRTPVLAAQAPASARLFSQSAMANRKVAVLGASGGIGQPVRIVFLTPALFAPEAEQGCV